MRKPLRVLVADDHAPTRLEVRAVLEANERFEVCADVPDAAAAVEAAAREKPDVCLLDVHMPGNGIAAVWEIAARLPQTKIVMLTVSEETGDLFAALRAGAAGYLLKDMDSGRLAAALLDVVEGNAAIPRRLVGRMLGEFRDRSSIRRATAATEAGERLTSREWQVLDLMREGHSTAEMARRLTLSQATVRSHVAAILRKLRVSSREEAVAAFEHTNR